MKGTILITGGSGQVGTCLQQQLSNSYDLVAPARNELDLAEPAALDGFFKKTSLTAVLNCAAYTAVDQAEAEPELADLVNHRAVAHLAELCHQYDVPLVHFSTDYVYDSGLTRPLIEEDPLNPRSVYARTKLAGEKAALQAHKHVYVIRTSWVYSEFGKNFVKTMLSLSRKGIHPKVVSDQTGCPTYARDIAVAIAALLDRIEDVRPGVYNFCNQGETTWFEFAKSIFRQSGAHIEVTPISTADFGAAAARPAYSVMDTSKFQRALEIIPRHWTIALADCIARLSEDSGHDN